MIRTSGRGKDVEAVEEAEPIAVLLKHLTESDWAFRTYPVQVHQMEEIILIDSFCIEPTLRAESSSPLFLFV